ncbi:MAG: GntR family transcriptional regulator [Nocardioidaceae bacterium]|nr:MAG: GntR family transcriptional regulator [Nocardioidaceae bacterium]
MIILDPAHPEPPYEQIRTQIAAQIEQGDLHAGDRLPTVRRLAQDLSLAVNTVARAYRELEQAGLIDTRGRAGSYVTGTGVEAEARAAAAEYVDKARALGLDPGHALGLVSQLFHA